MRGMSINSRLDIRVGPRGSGTAGAVSAYAAYALAERFTVPEYWVSGTQYSPITALPGYTFTRSGTQGAVDASGAVQFFAPAVPAINSAGYHAFGALTNIIFPSNNTTTQTTPALTAAPYTLSFFGTGTVTLSGASTAGPLVGTGASNRVVLVFTPTAAALTLTVSGTITNAGLLLGNFPDGGPIITTTTAAVGIGLSDLDTDTTLPDEDYILWVTGDFSAAPATYQMLGSVSNGTTSNQIYFSRTGSSVSEIQVQVGGAAVFTYNGIALSGTGRTFMVVRRKAGKFTAVIRKGGVTSTSVESGVVANPIGVTKLHAGLWPDGSFPLNGQVRGVFRRSGTFSDADLTALALEEAP